MEIENEDDFIPKKNILTDVAVCPNCSESVKITSKNKLLMSNGNNEEQNSLGLREFINVLCSKCDYNFTFIICAYCNEKIMMKIHPYSKMIECNGICGFNIRCPYKSCNKIFYFTKCKQCWMTIKAHKLIKEGDIINCQNENCKFQFIVVKHPGLQGQEIIIISLKEYYQNIKEKLFIKKLHAIHALDQYVFLQQKKKKINISRVKRLYVHIPIAKIFLID